MQYILEPHAHLLAMAQDVFGADLVTEAWIVYPAGWTEAGVVALVVALREDIQTCGFPKELHADAVDIALGFTNGRRILFRAARWTILRDITDDNQYLLRNA